LGTSDPLACSQYRQLARVILSQLPIGSNEPVLITGARDCRGIEQLVAGLGSAMAELFPGQILLVDALSHKSDRGEVFVPSESAGWTEVDVAHPKELRSAIRATDVEGVWYLPSRSNKDSYSSGVPSPAKSGILLRKALAELADQYGLMLIFADQASCQEIGEILPWCVATYVAIEIGSTTVEDAFSALSNLSQGGAQLHGFIATHADSVDRLVGVS